MFLRKSFAIFCTVLFMSANFHGYAGDDDGVSVYFYGRIPGCGCFYNCGCFSHYIGTNVSGGFPEDSKWHPYFPEDRVWHVFMKKFLTALQAGPYFNANKSTIRNMVSASNESGYVCLLSEYMNSINTLGNRIEQARIDNIKSSEKFYTDPKDREKLVKEIYLTNEKANKAFQILSTIPDSIIPIYKEILENCYHNQSYNMVPSYNRGLIALLEGNIEQSLSDIHTFIQLAKKNGKENLLTSEMLQREGEAYLEIGLYHQAIESLNQAISRDPKNFEAYFQRASAYFEIGDFEHSLDDYLVSKKSERFLPNCIPSLEFVDAFSSAAIDGACETACEFFPSLCHSVYGLGECLWAFGEHPLESIQRFAGSGYEMAEHAVDYLKTVDKEKLNEYVSELVRLYENYDHLSEQEKGHLIGYVVGKYGVDIFAGATAVKGVSAYKKLKEANRMCNLESMALSASSKEGVVSKGVQHYTERSKFFENSTIHWDRQNKHIPGKHNYLEGRSVFEHKDANGLLKKHAGTGTRKRGEMGQPGYQEVVDFKEHIGIWKNKVECRPTTKGRIHYSKDGAHIIPEHPEAKVW